MRLAMLAVGLPPMLCLLLANVPLPARAAQAADPLHTPECLQAQQALDTFEATRGSAAVSAPGAASGAAAGQPAASAPAVPQPLRALRADVARKCLASSLDAPRPQRQLQPPLAVAPVGSALAPRAAPLPPTAGQRANPGPVTQPPLRSITSCDAGGCWASDGTRLQRMGPSLVGPQGVCTVSGNVVSCP